MQKMEHPQYQMWDDEQCEKVVKATFEVLEKVGCDVKDADGRKLLSDAGCEVDGERVKIPEKLMRWAIDVAPSTVKLYNRLGEVAMDLSPWNVYYGPVITSVNTIDMETGEKRHATRADAAKFATVCDALPNVSWASAMAGIFDGVPELSDIYEVQALLPNTIKPIMCWASGKEHAALEFEMLSTVAGGEKAFQDKPFGIMLVCPLDPLVHTEEGVSQLIYLARKHMPVVYIAGASFGSSAPASVASGVVVGMADTLVGLVISQLACEGAPFVASKFSDNVDFRSGSASHSRPEADAANMASADVFRYLGLPFCLNEGCTDSATFDQVAAFDIGIQLYLSKLCGTNMSFAVGGFGTGNVSSPAVMVYCDEVIGYAKRLSEVPPVDDETLAVDQICEVGPGGNFLTEDETLEHCHDFWMPSVFKYRTFEQGVSGEDEPFEMFNARARELAAKGPSHPLDPSVKKALDDIVEKAEREIKD